MFVTIVFFFFQAEDGIRDLTVTGVQTCALPISSKARRVVQQLFEAFFKDVSLMPPEYRDQALRAETAHGAAARARAVADYIAGMTDRYALLEHRRLFEPGERT